MNYYYLIASLPEISIEDPQPEISTSETLDLIFRNLDEKDSKLGRYLIYQNDNQNLLNAILEHYHRFPASDFIRPSIYTKEEILQFLNKESDLPDYMTNYLNMFRDKLDLLRPSRLEEYMWIEFYDEVATLSHSFIRDYFIFDKILRQLAAIRNSKIHEVSLTSEFVNDKINRELNLSRPKSIITKTYPYVGELWDALDKQEPYIIEMTMDKIRWDFIENYDPLSHFSDTEVFGRILKLVIRDRWIKLSSERGKKHFEELCDYALINSGIAELATL